MATLESWYVDPDAVGAGTGVDWTNAYTSMNAATDAKAVNIATADKIMRFNYRSSAGTADTVQLSLSTSWTCDDTRYIEFVPASGQQAVKTGWSTSIYRLSITDAAAITTPNNVIVLKCDGMQIERVWTATSWDYVIPIYNAAAGTKYYFGKCRIRTNNANTGLLLNSDADATLYVYDSILEGTNRYGFNITNGAGYFYNSVLINSQTDAVIIAAGKTAVIKNCAVFNNTDDFQDDSGGTATIDYNASDDGDGTHAVAPSGSNWNNEFTDSTGNFTLLNTGNLFEGGVDDPGSGLYSDDMDGDNWASPWSIGVDQYMSSISIPLFIHHLRQQKAA